MPFGLILRPLGLGGVTEVVAGGGTAEEVVVATGQVPELVMGQIASEASVAEKFLTRSPLLLYWGVRGWATVEKREGQWNGR